MLFLRCLFVLLTMLEAADWALLPPGALREFRPTFLKVRGFQHWEAMPIEVPRNVTELETARVPLRLAVSGTPFSTSGGFFRFDRARDTSMEGVDPFPLKHERPPTPKVTVNLSKEMHGSGPPIDQCFLTRM